MFIKSLHLKNILSFKDTKLDLQPLNVLIGPNGSGKSNLIDVIGLLQAVPDDIAGYLRKNGPTGDWVWRGQQEDSTSVETVQINTILDSVLPKFDCSYDLGITIQASRLHFISESLGLVDAKQGTEIRPFFRASDGHAELWPDAPVDAWDDLFDRASNVVVNRDRSVFGEIRDPVEHGTLTETSRSLSCIKAYRSWRVGRDSAVRRPQRTDGDPNFLEEDFNNLALVVNDLLSRRLEPSLNDYLGQFYETYESLHSRIFGNTIELIVHETGMTSALPTSRLSDGTIRFIALLAILCHPDPPSLICIEEPEIAMHPDSLGLIAGLLRKASERTQIIVTTHSPEFVSHFSDEPENIVVCDRDAKAGTQFRRLSLQELTEWQDIYQQTGKELVVYGLSEMWMSGALGGVR